MHKLPAIECQHLIKFLKSIGFEIVRQKGSHIRLKAEDGRITTVPHHKGKILPKGLLRKIIREDLEMSLEEFFKIYSQYKS